MSDRAFVSNKIWNATDIMLEHADYAVGVAERNNHPELERLKTLRDLIQDVKRSVSVA